MIRTNSEHSRALERLAQEEQTIRVQHAHLEELGFTEKEVEQAMQPLLSFRAQLEEEVEAYARMKRGDLGPLESLDGIGRWLIGARIARGLSQSALAERLGVHESQVSRDERNDYQGVTAERAQRILEVLGVQFTAEAESLLEAEVRSEVA